MSAIVWINGEPCEKVTSFESLGHEIVWVTACGWCNRKHRGILVQRFDYCECLRANGTKVQTKAWEIAPRPRCASAAHPDRIVAVSPEDVERGFVYRVVNPPREVQEERTRELEVVR